MLASGTQVQAYAHGMTTELDWVPGSTCTLPTIEQPLRVAEFDVLFAAHLTGVERLDESHARLTLTGGPGLAGRARDLAERETGCCSFFTFTIDDLDADHGSEGVHMRIAVPAVHVTVLAGLLARAQSVRAAAQAHS
jgi:hypothetical protein